ncbi:glutathione S-transferase family protein [Tychonema sp. LEGE 07199]|uniref:glutathione S-transferase family protein n=1 Tax=Microcoleaceae TaxID=1892252 RepID=UPI00187E4B96|nr:MULTISPECIES: glutathione S-transferase family protein [unclassified Tychonema]MBE9121350.1 glutathione S-transferase family protein [Tychonema sp. LEGE 07199]MBE9134209.1 glutathione S-transferase family protein [Tychonema sp. LEGE 07196]MBE9163262.1 glutathione S-transferase family protein [Tychonema sp. LEGE 06208]
MTELTLVIGNKNYSSWSLRAWLVMKQAGLEFTEVRIPLDGPTSHAEIRRYSPSGKVPVLIDGDLKVWESLAICEYVADRYAHHLWPADIAQRAIARSICAEMHAGFQNLRQNMPMDCRNRYPGEGMTASVEAEIYRIFTLWHECRQNFGTGGPMLFGKFTIVDAMFAPIVLRFVTYGVKFNAEGKAYADAILAIPAIQEWLAAAYSESENIPHFKI